MKLRISLLALAVIGCCSVASASTQGSTFVEGYPNLQFSEEPRAPGMPFVHSPAKILLGKSTPY